MDSGLSPATEHEYQIRCINIDNLEGQASATATAITHPPPSAPVLKSVVQTGPNSLRVEWEPLSLPRLSGFDVYRTLYGGSTIKVNASKISKDSSRVSLYGLAHSVTSSYFVKAVDEDGNESIQSDPILAEGFEGGSIPFPWTQTGDTTWDVVSADRFSGSRALHGAIVPLGWPYPVLELKLDGQSISSIRFRCKVTNPSGSDSWVSLFVWGEPNYYSGTHDFSPDEWTTVILNLTSSGEKVIDPRIRFSFVGGTQEALSVQRQAFIDDIEIR
jgi:hypothetical protein